MNNRQRAKIDSYNRIRMFNGKYRMQTATIAEYAAEENNFNAAFIKISEALNVQVSVQSISSKNISALKNTMAATVIKYALRASVKAKQISNTGLADALSVPVTFISLADKTLALHRAQDIVNMMENNLGVLTNLTAANIAEMKAAIILYDSSKDQPREILQNKKAGGTDILPAQLTIADSAVDNMYNLLRSYFETDNPALVDEFSLAMEVIDTGIRHTSIDFTVLDSQDSKAVAAASITDLSNNKIYTGDAEGNVHIASHRTGHFNFIIDAAGKQPVNFGTDISRGKQNAFTIKMNAANSSSNSQNEQK